MGQEEVLKILKESKRPLTSKEISQLLKIGSRTATRILRALRKDCSINIGVRRLSMQEVLERYGRRLNSPKLNVYFLEKK